MTSAYREKMAISWIGEGLLERCGGRMFAPWAREFVRRYDTRPSFRGNLMTIMCRARKISR